jgi:hypothetical protein
MAMVRDIAGLCGALRSRCRQPCRRTRDELQQETQQRADQQGLSAARHQACRCTRGAVPAGGYKAGAHRHEDGDAVIGLIGAADSPTAQRRALLGLPAGLAGRLDRSGNLPHLPGLSRPG